MKNAVEIELRRIRILLTLIVVLLALQFIPSQPIKDFVGLALFVLAGLYALLMLLESLLESKVNASRDSEALEHLSPRAFRDDV